MCGHFLCVVEVSPDQRFHCVYKSIHIWTVKRVFNDTDLGKPSDQRTLPKNGLLMLRNL